MTLLDRTTPRAPAAAPAARGRSRRLRLGLVLPLAVLALVLVALVAPSLLTAGADPLKVDVAQTLAAPSAAHPFGTDQNGRDILARVVYGARPSLTIGVAATALGLLIAIVLGLLAGLGGRLVDSAVGRLLEVLFAFPALLLALLLIAMFGAGATTLVIAVGVGNAPGYARMVRGQVRSVRGRPYVEAAYVLGHPFHRIVTRTILPNALRPLVVLATLGVGQSIVWATSLSFLGLGAPPPSAEWGSMLAAGRDFISTSWWVEFFPGAAIVVVALAVTTVGRRLQQSMEGRASW